MYWDIVEVKPVERYSLWVRFADGVAGIVRLNPEGFTGVLSPLIAPEFFEKVYIDHGAPSWPGDIDLAPDAIYRETQNNA